MKQLAITALLALTGISANAQIEEYRQVTPFNAMEVGNGIEVIFTQSDAPSLRVESDNEAYLENIVTEVKGNTLKIHMGQNSEMKQGLGTARVYVSQKNVTAFKAATGASVKITGKLTADTVTIKLATGSAFTGMLETKTACVKAASGSVFRGNVVTTAFDGTVSGGATIKVIGTSGETNVVCNGGVLQAGKLISDKANIIASNAGSAYVNAVTSIRVNADSSSSVTYYGEPGQVDLSTNTYAVKKDSHKFALN